MIQFSIRLLLKCTFSQGCFKCCVSIIVTMETNPKKCFFCDLVIDKNKIVTVGEKGLKRIISASKERNDNRWVLLKDLNRNHG